MKTPKTTSISPLRMTEARIRIVGTAPLVLHAFAAKAREQMKLAQIAGARAKSKRAREPKDFELEYQQARHIAEEGWDGIPASAFRQAMISACRVGGFVMARAKLAIYIVGDGYDATHGVQLVRITKGDPMPLESLVRIGGRNQSVADIRIRPQWAPGWEAQPLVRWDTDVFGLADIVALLTRAGQQVGIGEGRPDSKQSHGMGWGLFDLAEVVDVRHTVQSSVLEEVEDRG